jgi:hypothetical protein
MSLQHCEECHSKTTTISTGIVQNDKHFVLKLGKWCKKCRIIYIDKGIKVNEIKFVPIILNFGWGNDSKTSRSKKVHWFEHKHSIQSICGKEKVYNDNIIRFFTDEQLFKNQKCTHCLNQLEIKNEPIINVVSV